MAAAKFGAGAGKPAAFPAATGRSLGSYRPPYNRLITRVVFAEDRLFALARRGQPVAASSR